MATFGTSAEQTTCSSHLGGVPSFPLRINQCLCSYSWTRVFLALDTALDPLKLSLFSLNILPSLVRHLMIHLPPNLLPIYLFLLHPLEAAVVGVDDPEGIRGLIIKAFVVLRPPYRPSAALTKELQVRFHLPLARRRVIGQSVHYLGAREKEDGTLQIPTHGGVRE